MDSIKEDPLNVFLAGPEEKAKPRLEPRRPQRRNEPFVLHSAVGARLQRFWQEWQQISADPWTIQVLKEGYAIPFLSKPPLVEAPVSLQAYSHNSAKLDALRSEVRAMLEKEAIEQLHAPLSPGFYNRLFLVTKASGGWRPVLDVSALNVFVQKTKFSMETTQSVLASLHQGDWMVSIDLQDAYFHVPIHPASRKFLRFVFEGQVYQFRSLCFGLSTAPQVFTRILLSVARHLHLEGIRVSMYLDDWLLKAASRESCLEDLSKTLQLTKSLGLIINEKKSCLIPSQQIVYLGVSLDSQTFQAFLSNQRIASCLQKIDDFLQRKICSANEWMSLVGTLTSVEKFVKLGRLNLRPLQFYLQEKWPRKQFPDSFTFAISEKIKECLRWWRSEGRLSQGLPLQLPNPDLTLFSDASDKGWGATMGTKEVSGQWQREERNWHINRKELKAVHLALLAFQKEVEGKCVLVQADNTTALAYIRKQGGTHSWSLYETSRELLVWTEEIGTRLVTRFIQGEKNVAADLLSRKNQVLSNEWTLHPLVCEELWKIWGRPLIDLFATDKTTRLPLYCSPVPDNKAVFVDAMFMDWSDLDLYAFPPFKILRQVISKFSSHRNVRMTLVAPFWPSREWFPDLLNLLSDFPRLLPERPDLLRQPHFQRFHQNLSALHLVACRLSGDSSEREAFQERLRKLSRSQEENPPTMFTRRSGHSLGPGVEEKACLLLRRL